MLKLIFDKPKPIIGMVHLKPLPGSPLYRPGSMNDVCATAREEALLLQAVSYTHLRAHET